MFAVNANFNCYLHSRIDRFCGDPAVKQVQLKLLIILQPLKVAFPRLLLFTTVGSKMKLIWWRRFKVINIECKTRPQRLT